ncbi:MAG: polyprenyl synthetase family protein [Deltaproteobacteria bacterium]|nr:polyprenyl synthetase family protein [Deltaproteobacteria bacterium]
MSDEVQGWLAERTALVDTVLERTLPDPARPPQTLHAAMRHLVFPGGKRLRPALAMAASEAVGGTPEAALPMAVAVELIHTYSLVHDDLPCMDDDDLRRGRPTVHIEYGEEVAVLAGDALQSLAFETLAMGAGKERAAATIADLARAVGAAGLVGGQADDLTQGPGRGDVESVLSIHARKSAALIAVSVVGGARLGGADEDLLFELDEFGREVGVAFQITDDLLDAGEDEGCSLVPLLGEADCRERAEALLATALARIAVLDERAEPLRALARFAVRRGV